MNTALFGRFMLFMIWSLLDRSTILTREIKVDRQLYGAQHALRTWFSDAMGWILWQATFGLLLCRQWSHPIGGTLDSNWSTWKLAFWFMHQKWNIKRNELLCKNKRISNNAVCWCESHKVMETVQVEGFQTCYNMYRNLTDKAGGFFLGVLVVALRKA